MDDAEAGLIFGHDFSGHALNFEFTCIQFDLGSCKKGFLPITVMQYECEEAGGIPRIKDLNIRTCILSMLFSYCSY